MRAEQLEVKVIPVTAPLHVKEGARPRAACSGPCLPRLCAFPSLKPCGLLRESLPAVFHKVLKRSN